MPQHKLTPGSAQDWIARARGDLALARSSLPEGGYYEDLCFHAQQAAEKSLKSIYQYFEWEFRYTHDLEELITGLKAYGLKIPAEVEAAIILSIFAWEARYPGLYEPVSFEEYQEAIKNAENVVCWAEELIK